MRRRTFKHQFRLVWRYQGESRDRVYVSDNQSAVLRMLRRVGTDEPWLGVSPTQLKRTWAWVMRRLNLGADGVADMGPKQALLALRDSYPKLDYIRVETRQVAPWVEMIDPLTHLRQPSTEAADKRKRAMVAAVEAMSRPELDAWRWIPDPTADRFRRRQG